jgi:sulfide:quinone oxidoreductase
MPSRVVILGAGFGGLELATRLSDEVPHEVEVTLIDQNDSFVFGFSKLEVMFGHEDASAVRCFYADLAKPGVRFVRATITAIDPRARRVTTDAGTFDADILVVALGADLDPGATPGLEEAGYEFYSLAGAEQVREVLPGFRSGAVVIAVLGGFFKCPPAPNEAAFMLHDFLTAAGVRDGCAIHLLSPLPSPIPISPVTSAAIISMLEERRIDYRPGTLVSRLDPGTKVAHLSDGTSLAFDLFLGVPVHCAPPVLVASGLTDDGWVSVNPVDFTTRFPDVFAVGDVTNAPVPRAGAIAEGEAATVADVIIARIRGTAKPGPYAGRAVCYIETGDREVAKVDVDFFADGGPTADFKAPSRALAAEKQAFGATRRARWFGYDR